MAKAAPRIDLRIVADWGNANFHMIAGWILANMRWRSPPRSQFWVKTGTGFRDNIEALANAEVDIAITTPYDICLEWAREGRHFFAGQAYPFIRALGYLPQDDRLVFCVREDTGITSFDDIRARKFPLRLATTTRDQDNLLTWLVERILELHGIPPAIEQWGGKWLGHDHPRKCLPQAINGEANAVCNEGIMVPQWYELVEKVPMRFLSMEEAALGKLVSDYGVRRAILPKGRLKADRDIACVDFSNWAIIVRDDMYDDLAYRIVAVMVEERAEFEARFRHLPVERSPMTYPIDPYKMCKGLGAPLHPGAERYYREHGYLKD